MSLPAPPLPPVFTESWAHMDHRVQHLTPHKTTQKLHPVPGSVLQTLELCHAWCCDLGGSSQCPTTLWVKNLFLTSTLHLSDAAFCRFAVFCRPCAFGVSSPTPTHCRCFPLSLGGRRAAAGGETGISPDPAALLCSVGGLG